MSEMKVTAETREDGVYSVVEQHYDYMDQKEEKNRYKSVKKLEQYMTKEYVLDQVNNVIGEDLKAIDESMLVNQKEIDEINLKYGETLQSKDYQDFKKMMGRKKYQNFILVGSVENTKLNKLVESSIKFEKNKVDTLKSLAHLKDEVLPLFD
jgi:hypothetical protein